MAETLPGVTDEELLAAGMLPTVANLNRNALAVDVARSGERTAHPAIASAGLPSVGAAPEAPAPTPGGMPAVEPVGLARPTKAQSQAAGKAEYAAGLPSVTAQPFTPDYYRQSQELADFKAAHPLGSTISAKPGIGGKIEHTLADVGNIAGNALIPNVMARIPGTERFKEEQNAARSEGFEKAVGEQEKQATTDLAKQGWQPITMTDSMGRQITVPQKFAGALAGAVERGNVSEDTTGKRIEGRHEDVATQEAGKGERQGEAIAARPPKTVVMEDESGKPFEYQYDAKQTYTGDQGRDHWKKIGPAQPNVASLGLVGTLTPLINPQTGDIQGAMNTKTGEIKPINMPTTFTQGGGPAPTTTAGARLENTRQNQFNTQYVNPANQAEQQYQRATEAVEAYNSNPKTGAAAMVLFAQHLGTTLGGIKGAAIGEGAQKAHLDAIGLEDKLSRFVDYLKTGQPLSANQVHDFYQLIQNTRNLQWTTAAREAARRKVPIDFLPADVNINMKSPNGKPALVPGNRVNEFVEKGATIDYGK